MQGEGKALLRCINYHVSLVCIFALGVRVILAHLVVLIQNYWSCGHSSQGKALHYGKRTQRMKPISGHLKRKLTLVQRRRSLKPFSSTILWYTISTTCVRWRSVVTSKSSSYRCFSACARISALMHLSRLCARRLHTWHS